MMTGVVVNSMTADADAEAAARQTVLERIQAIGRQLRELDKTRRAQRRKYRVCPCGSGKRWLKCCWPANG